MNQLSTQALAPRLIHASLEQLSEDTNGVRKTNGVSIDELAASIAAEGLIQNLTVVPSITTDEGPKFMVVAGCRRLRAMRKLAAENRLPADIAAAGVPCRLIDPSQALTASLAENAIREPMHPADEFVAFRDMIDQGRSIDDVSARFGVTPAVVQRRLKLANVAPKIFELFRTDNGITLAQMMALAIVDDHAAQEKAWFKAPNNNYRSPEQLRAALTKHEVDASRDPVARFVGLQEYERAGGRVHRDLFDDKGSGYIIDTDLLEQLATKRFASVADRVRKEGWSFVEVRKKIAPYTDLAEYSRAEPAGKRKPDDAEKKRVDALKKDEVKNGKRIRAIYDARTNETWDRDEIEADALRTRNAEIRAELEELEQARTKWDPKILAKGGAIIGLDSDTGALQVFRGLVKGKLRQAKDAKKKNGKDAESDAQQPGHTDALTRELTAHATFAIAAELTTPAGHAVALAALAHKLLLDQFFHNTSDSVVCIQADRNYPHKPLQAQRAEGLGGAAGTSPDLARLATERAAVKALLPSKSAELLPFLLKAKPAIIARLLAYCVAESVDATEGGAGPDRTAKQAAPLADALKLDMGKRWTARRETYLGRVNAATILAALKDARADKAAIGKAEKLKKSELIDFAQPLLKTWLPKILRFGGK